MEIKISHSEIQSCLNLEQAWEISTSGNLRLPSCNSLYSFHNGTSTKPNRVHVAKARLKRF